MKLKLPNHLSYATSRKRLKKKNLSDGPKMKTKGYKPISSSKNSSSWLNKINKSKIKNEEKKQRRKLKILNKRS